MPPDARIREGLPADLFKPRTNVTDTAHRSGRSTPKLEEEAVEPVVPLVAVAPVASVTRLVSCGTRLVCDFCGGTCGPIVRLAVHRRLARTRRLIWPSKGLADAGVLVTADEEVLQMKLDPSRVRRPIPRFKWGWVDRRIVLDGYLTPMSRTEVAVYFFLCVVADGHGMSWYGPRAMARLLKEPPDQISEALISLGRRNLVALAGRFIQVLELDTGLPVPGPAHGQGAPPQAREVFSAESARAGTSAHDELARLPHQQREELLRRARERMAAFLGSRDPSTSALEAVAAGLLREQAK